jgi:transcription elongation factor SPT5
VVGVSYSLYVQSGSETSVLMKLLERQLSLQERDISCALSLPTLPSYVFVEGRNFHNVWRICSELSDVYESKGMVLMPLDERTDLFTCRTEDRRVKAHTWVRLRRGLNKGDLAYVLRSSVNSDVVQIAVLPRIPFSLPDDRTRARIDKRRKLNTPRPPQLSFDPKETRRIHGPGSVTQMGEYLVFQGKTFLRGMQVLKIHSTLTLLRVPSPPLDALKPFIDAGFITPPDALAATSSAIAALVRPGDSVELIAGEQRGCRAMVVTCHDDVAVVDVQPFDSNLRPLDCSPFLLTVPLKNIQRIFRVGDNVRVRTNEPEHGGSTGCVVAVLDNGKCLSFLEDKTRRTVSLVFWYPGVIEILNLHVD